MRISLATARASPQRHQFRRIPLWREQVQFIAKVRLADNSPTTPDRILYGRLFLSEIRRSIRSATDNEAEIAACGDSRCWLSHRGSLDPVRKKTTATLRVGAFRVATASIVLCFRSLLFFSF